MNKKVMAIAVAGALAVPAAAALAQTSTVQIGGSLTGFWYRHSPNNPGTAKSGDIAETSEPELFIRGEENLGGGLSAWFQCTSSLDGMIGGAAAVADSGWCARNSGIGFKGGMGNIFLGNWDQPQKLVFNAARKWWGGTNSLTGGSAVLLNNGSASGTRTPVQTTAGFVSAAAVASTVTTTISNNPGTFFRRQASTINYHSPSWNGFSTQAAFSAGNENTGLPEASPLSPRMYSLAGQYSSGPLYVGLAYERHNDFNPANQAAAAYAGGSDDNWTLVMGYNFGQFDVRGLVSRSRYDTTLTTNLDVNGWGLWADWAIQGPHTLRAHYVRVGDTSGTSAVAVGSYKGPAGAGCGAASATSCATSTGAHQWGVAYSYAFSKRTMGSLVYTKMDNDSGATFSRGKVNATAGNSQTSTGLVIQHRF